ncbi:MAG TPA: protein kinase [Dongiaceae bacterium]|jgi:serine/threonine protein kinase|nr:protein kinase [Dongiaceae bacterium]
MKLRDIKKIEPLVVPSRVSKLARVEFERSPYPALLKEPAHFWDEVLIANEAYVLDEVTHPHIRRKLAYDANTHQLFLEYIEGVTLDELVIQGVTRANPARTHRLLQSLAETVADMHAGIFCGRPIVHNDLKSKNVLIPTTAPDETQLIDFSHSFFEGNLPPFITDKKQDPLGTAHYSAPEKWDGDFTKGFKSDVFAFGVTAYHAYMGEYPFDGSPGEIEQGIRERQQAALLQPGHNLIRNTAAVIMSCLEKSPDRRPTMEQVAEVYAKSASLLK